MEHGVNPIYYQITVAARLVGIPPARVRRYVNAGLVRAVPSDRGVPLLGVSELIRLRKIRRLTNDLGLNTSGVEIVLRLLDEIEALRAGDPQMPLETERAMLGLLEKGHAVQR